MFQFFDFIIEFISTIVNLVVGFFESVVSFIVQISNAYMYIKGTIQALPPFCQGALLLITTVSLLTVVLGSLLDF